MTNNQSVTFTQKHNRIVGYYEFEKILKSIEKPGDLDYYKKLRDAYCSDKTLFNKMKKALPSFIVTGRFSPTIRKEDLKDYTHLIMLDFDNVGFPNMERVKEQFSQCDYTRACFLSPSGNGLKVVAAVDSHEEHHEVAFRQLASFYENIGNVGVDRSGRNINRTSYATEDKNLYYNHSSSSFPVDLIWSAEQTEIFPKSWW